MATDYICQSKATSSYYYLRLQSLRGGNLNFETNLNQGVISCLALHCQSSLSLSSSQSCWGQRAEKASLMFIQQQHLDLEYILHVFVTGKHHSSKFHCRQSANFDPNSEEARTSWIGKFKVCFSVSNLRSEKTSMRKSIQGPNVNIEIRRNKI